MTDAPPLTAIETRYAGHRFRSRLEARWAVFFDRLGFNWRYEVQGHVVGGIPYLPDFEVDFGLRGKEPWLVEVKGDPAKLDTDLMRAAATTLHRNILILGDVPVIGLGQTGASHWSVGYNPQTIWHMVTFWATGIIPGWAPYSIGWDYGDPPPSSEILGGGTVLVNNPAEVIAAYDTARTARFEHGETPRPVTA